MKAGDRARIVKIQGYPNARESHLLERDKRTLTRGLADDLKELNLAKGSEVEVTDVFDDGYVEIEEVIHIPQDCLEEV